MNKVKIEFEYNNLGNNSLLLTTDAGYSDSSNNDQITITQKTITIEGNRSKKSTPDSILNNTSSTLYKQLLKAIVYTYMTTGIPFSIKKISITVNGDCQEYYSGSILNPCPMPLEGCNLIRSDECKEIFKSNPKSDKLLISYIWFIKGVNGADFDYLWKAFNSLYSIISTGSTEFDRLCDTKKFIIANWNDMKRTDNCMDIETTESIRALRIREYILNDFEDVAKTTAYYDMVKSFRDYRLAQLFSDIMAYRKDNLMSKGLYNDLELHIKQCIQEKKKANSDLARFYILKYSYFIRNKYFHAEKGAPTFILPINNEVKELNHVRKILSLFLCDLYDLSSKM